MRKLLALLLSSVVVWLLVVWFVVFQVTFLGGELPSWATAAAFWSLPPFVAVRLLWRYRRQSI